MDKHKTHLTGQSDNFDTLASELGDLRYDSLSEFLELLAKKLNKDSLADGKRNRTQLARELLDASTKIQEASKHIEKAWDICEPYM